MEVSNEEIEIPQEVHENIVPLIDKPLKGRNDNNTKRSTKSESERKLSDFKIGFVGAGRLSFAIVCGIIEFANIKPKRIYVSAKTDKNLSLFRKKGCNVTKRNYDIFGRYDCDIVFLCFHGSIIKQCYRLGSSGKPIPFTITYIPVPNHTIHVLSLVSGVTLDQITECLINPQQLEDFPLNIHRLMLNTGTAYGSAAGLGAIDLIPEVCNSFVIELLSKISTLEHIPESQMDCFCSFGGNGLPLSYHFGSALVKTAIDMRIETTTALRLSALTMKCAAETVLQTGKSPLQLMDKWTSLSSPTSMGIQILKDSYFDSAVKNAMQAIYERIQDLNQFIISKEPNY